MLDKEHQIGSSPWPEKSSSLVREAWHMKSQCNPVRWLNDGLVHGSLNSAWEEKREGEQGRPPKRKEVWMEEICREASRIISCLMTHCGSLLLHGSQDCICLIQSFWSPCRPFPKWLSGPFSFPVPLCWVPHHRSLFPSQALHIHIFLFLLGLYSLLGMPITPLSVHWAPTHPSRSSTNATFSVTISLPLDNHSTCGTVL